MLIVDDKAISNDIKLMEQKLEEVREQDEAFWAFMTILCTFFIALMWLVVCSIL